MKREIKFRAWNGHEIVYDVMVGKFGAFYINPGDNGNGLDPNDSASLTPFNTKYFAATPIMQYTGLKDKNGKEVYEGDIIECDSAIHTGVVYRYMIVWNDLIGRDEAAYFAEKVGTDDKYILFNGFGINTRIIGNIYENPELLNSSTTAKYQKTS
jgi:uncharacterized phage protein (TIGR01671 family)